MIRQKMIAHLLPNFLSGSTVTLAVEPTDITQAIMAKLGEKSSVPTHSLRLVFAGKQLRDLLTLDAHCVCAGSTLHLEGVCAAACCCTTAQTGQAPPVTSSGRLG
jgi:hypothetical protein